MANVYELNTIADLLKVPVESLDACLRDLRYALELCHFAGGEDTPTMAFDSFAWTDDGQHNIDMSMNGEPFLKLNVTDDPALSHAAGQDGEQCLAASGEDAYVIEQMGRLLAEIAVIVNGPEPARTRWSYHDLPEKVRALQEQRVASPEIPFLATPMTDYSEGYRLRWEYEKGWNACREYALRALSRGVPEGMMLVPVEPTPEMIASCPGGLLAPACVAVYKTMISAAITAQRKEG